MNLVVSRPGGETTPDGKKIRAIETEYPLFRLGEQYLFFLRRQPSGSFFVGPSDAFLITGTGLKAASKHPGREAVSLPLPYVEREIIAAAASNVRRER